MNRVDDVLQRRFKDMVAQIAVDPSVEIEVLERSRTRRRLVAGGVGLMVTLLIGGIAGASMWLPKGELGVTGDQNASESFARFFFSAAGGDVSANGVVEVGGPQESICLEATMSRNIRASHLLDLIPENPEGSPTKGPPAIVATFFEPEDGAESNAPPSGTVCASHAQFDKSVIDQIISQPDRFAIDFHEAGPNEDPVIVTELRDSPGPLLIQLSQPPIETQGYVFRDFSVRFTPSYDDPTTGVIFLRAHIGWDGGFPGSRTCTVDIYSSDDTLIASSASRFISVGPGPGVLRDSLPVDGIPDRVDVACSQERLDDPNGVFGFDPVTIEEDPLDQRLIARSSYTWEGEGHPTPQNCTLIVFDQAGQELFRVERGLTAADGAPHFMEFRLEPPAGSEAEIETAQIECKPIK